MNGRMDLVIRLRKVFNNSGKTQTEIAKKTNVTSAYIWKILNNDNVCPRDLFIKSVCKEFNVNEDWLRNGGADEDMFIQTSDFSLDEFAKLHNASESDYQLIRNYLSLNSDIRTQIQSLFSLKE